MSASGAQNLKQGELANSDPNNGIPYSRKAARAVVQRYFEKLSEVRRRRAAGEEFGFTLIELLIVIVVLGILAATVIFALSGVTASSAVAACNSDAKSVEVAVQAWEAQNPGSTAGAITSTGGGDGYLVGGTPTYLQTWPNSTNYTIAVASGGNVMVTAGTATTPANYNTNNQCASA